MEKCALCESEASLINCDECKERVCFQCRKDCTEPLSGVWVLTFCYKCHPELVKEEVLNTSSEIDEIDPDDGTENY